MEGKYKKKIPEGYGVLQEANSNKAKIKYDLRFAALL